MTHEELMELLGYQKDGLKNWFVTPSGYTHKMINPDVEEIIKWSIIDHPEKANELMITMAKELTKED